jgi:hypothetical protein
MMNYMHRFLFILSLCVSILSASHAHAACSATKPINQSHTLGLHATHPITTCIKEGEDPVVGYLRSEGKAFSRTKVHAILPRSMRSARALPNTYKRDACDPDRKKAGGFSTAGATNPCETGVGIPLTTLPPQQVNIPVCNDCNDCGVGLLGALLGSFVGGTPPDLSNTFSTSGNISRNGCVSGSIGICGLGSIGGGVCPSTLIRASGMQQPTTPRTRSNRAQSNNPNPSYIRINAPSLQIATPKTKLHNGTTNYLPDGGLLRVCASGGGCWDVNVPINGHVVIGSDGVLRVGCPTCPPAGTGEYIVGRHGMGTGKAFDLDKKKFEVTLIPKVNKEGETIILADENLVQGSGPRGISSLNTPVETQQVVSIPSESGTERAPDIITVQSRQRNTRLPTAQTQQILQEAQIPNSTCVGGGTSCFVGSFAPLAPTENETPPEEDNSVAPVSTPLLD